MPAPSWPSYICPGEAVVGKPAKAGKRHSEQPWQLEPPVTEMDLRVPPNYEPDLSEGVQNRQ